LFVCNMLYICVDFQRLSLSVTIPVMKIKIKILHKMITTKKFLKSKPLCKVSFKLPAELAKNAETVAIVGEFNDWSPSNHIMDGLKDGSFKITLDLETGRPYQFKYLVDGTEWINDDAADAYVANEFNGENSVVTLN